MRNYLSVISNHFRALQEWAIDKEAQLDLDVKTFVLEVKHRGRYYHMYPLFQASSEGQLRHTGFLPKDVVGFGGWRPYPPIRHPHSLNKLLFKDFLRKSELRTPTFLTKAGQSQPEFDYILKGTSGSFGREIAGPFRASQPADLNGSTTNPPPSTHFVEKFIEGTSLKVWFWGAKAFFAHAQSFPEIEGDGVTTVESLLRQRLTSCRLDWEHFSDRSIILECLRFQNISSGAVLKTGESLWFDYRYGKHYEPVHGATPDSDNNLPSLLEQTGTQIHDMGSALANLLKPNFAAPIMISVDGMLDHDGNIWWLEMNTNSLMPPEGYAAMFSDIFP
ncbi:hypothetical protein [Variovorax terrae]|uniref:Uncharacterized protein n=1 Tax=Variovorax terrae TaxID=2923278 RepID=A0A9X1W1M5_9BURK|nr:hypothetical protein [Variovorax terrae]MCJ0764498.1 hypothetical protein [Variovorax terrae]